MSPLSTSLRFVRIASFAWMASVLATILPAQAPVATGAIQGRIFNASSGDALRNVEVSIPGTAHAVLTDEEGGYRLTGVPAGPVRLSTRYLGFATQTVVVTVSPGARALQDFQLMRTDMEETVRLDKFTVVADREMSAQAVALNERRTAANIKNVVAYDEYGDRSAENIGDFLRFLPGVGIDEPAQIAATVTLRGFPASFSGIQIDGADVASARGNSREQTLLDIPVGNVSRVEVTKVPTPDLPASGLGGSLNIIRKTGFEYKKPVFTYQAYYFLDQRKLAPTAPRRGLSNDLSPAYYQPAVEFSAIMPLNKKFALTLSGSRTWRYKPMEEEDYTDTQADWDFVNGHQRVSTWQSLNQVLYTWSGQVGADWKISENDVLSINGQYRHVVNNIMRVDLVANYGAGATGNRSFTQGAATGVGTVTQAGGANQAGGADTYHATAKYTHRDDNWKLEAFGAFSASQSFLDDIDDGHFNTAGSTLTGIVLRGEGIDESDDTIPIRYSATRGGMPIDIFSGANYVIGNPTSAQNKIKTDKYTARLDLVREFDGVLPLSLRAGVYWDRFDRDRRAFNKTWTFRPNGLTTPAARTATNFDVFDQAFNATAPTVYGWKMDWISVTKLYDLYLQHPDWFALNEASYYQGLATNSSQLTETVSAAYLRGDIKLFNRRLALVGGIRFEKTEDEGRGLRDDPSAQYQKDGSGNLILSGGAPVLISTDAIVRARLRYQERATHATRTYDGWYPSINATLNLTDKLLLRAAYARTLGRPDIGNIVPGANFSEPTVVQPTITVNNTGLKPWTADNYDISLESYQIKGGFGSVGIFHKNVRDFFGSVTYDATPELLAQFGLPNDPQYLDYDIVTSLNTGAAQITGYEFAYNQSLFFLPRWARGLQVFVSATKLQLKGDRTADFTGYSPTNYAGGINLVRDRFYVKFTVTYQGQTRGSLTAVSTANGIPPDTYNYQGERLRFGLNTQYTFSRKFSVYASIANIGGFTGGNLRFNSTTPDFMKQRRKQEFPATLQIGIKGQF